MADMLRELARQLNFKPEQCLLPEFGHLMIRNADPTNGFGITVDAATIGTFWNLHILTQKANTVPIAVVTASFFSEVYGTDVAATNAIVLPDQEDME